MNIVDLLTNREQNYDEKSWNFLRKKLSACHNLYSKDLLGHYGCVNAIDFSQDGRLLVSGSDDRRVLLWNCDEIIQEKNCNAVPMKKEHLSNIFCASIDVNKQFIFSAGNDEYLIQHDIQSGEMIRSYYHDEPIYAIDVCPDNSCIYATASEDGSVEICDTRQPNDKMKLAISAGSFHGVAFNPVESCLVATANSHDGIKLHDTRKKDGELIHFGKDQKEKNRDKGTMSVRFNYTGQQIFVLQRKKGPVVYNVDEPQQPICFSHRKYDNLVTMKSACYAGDKDQFIVSGSDDFSIYIWKVPDTSQPVKKEVEDAYMVLNGHRSIVNQVRFNRHNHLFASGGVEKVVKVWSPFRMHECAGDTLEDDYVKRKPYTHEEYMNITTEIGGPVMTHDYDDQSLDEDTRMIAFFDSLREQAREDDDDDSETELQLEQADNILNILLDNQDILRAEDESASPNQTNSLSDNPSPFGINIEELRRIFRSDSTRNNNNTMLDDVEVDIKRTSETGTSTGGNTPGGTTSNQYDDTNETSTSETTVIRNIDIKIHGKHSKVTFTVGNKPETNADNNTSTNYMRLSKQPCSSASTSTCTSNINDVPTSTCTSNINDVPNSNISVIDDPVSNVNDVNVHNCCDSDSNSHMKNDDDDDHSETHSCSSAKLSLAYTDNTEELLTNDTGINNELCRHSSNPTVDENTSGENTSSSQIKKSCNTKKRNYRKRKGT